MASQDFYKLIGGFLSFVEGTDSAAKEYSKGRHNRLQPFVRQRIKLIKEIHTPLIDLQKKIDEKKTINDLEYVAKVKAEIERSAREHEEQVQREEKERLQREDQVYNKEEQNRLWDESAAQQQKEAEQRAAKREKFVKSEKERKQKSKEKMNKSINNALKTPEKAQENSTDLKPEGNKENQENSTDGTKTKVEPKPESEVNSQKTKNKDEDNDKSKDGEKHEIDSEQDKKPKDSGENSSTGENLEKNDDIGAKGTKKHKKKDDNDEKKSGSATSEKQKDQDNNDESAEKAADSPKIEKELPKTPAVEQNSAPNTEDNKKGEDSNPKEQTPEDESKIKSEDNTKLGDTPSEKPKDQDSTNKSDKKSADSTKIETEPQKTPAAEQNSAKNTEDNKKGEDSTTKQQTPEEKVEIEPKESDKPEAVSSEEMKVQDSTKESAEKVIPQPEVKEEFKEKTPSAQNKHEGTPLTDQNTEDNKKDKDSTQEKQTSEEKVEIEHKESDKSKEGLSEETKAQDSTNESNKKVDDSPKIEKESKESDKPKDTSSEETKDQDSTNESNKKVDDSPKIEKESKESDKPKDTSSEETKAQDSTNESTEKESKKTLPTDQSKSEKVPATEQNSAKNTGDNKEDKKPNLGGNEQKLPPVEADQPEKNLDDKKTDTHGEEKSSVPPEKKELPKDDKSQKNEEPNKPKADDVNNDNDAPPQGGAQTSTDAPAEGAGDGHPATEAQITPEQQQYISNLANVYTKFIQESSGLGGDLSKIKQFIQARYQNTVIANQLNNLKKGYEKNANLSVQTNKDLAELGTVEEVFEDIIFLYREKVLKPIILAFKQEKEKDEGKNTKDFKGFVSSYVDLLHYMQSMNTDGLSAYYKGNVFTAAGSCLCSIYYSSKVTVPKKIKEFKQFVQKIPTEEIANPNLRVCEYIAKVGELYEKALKALPQSEGNLDAAKKYIETASNPQFSLNKKFKELRDDYVVYSMAKVSQIAVLKAFKTVEDTFVGMLELFNKRVLNPILRKFIEEGNALSAEVNKCENKICTDTSKGNAFQGFIRDNAPILQRVIELLQIQDDLDGNKGRDLFLNVWCNLCAQSYKSPSIESVELLENTQLQPNEIHDLTSLAYAQFGAKPQEGEEPKDIEPHLVSLNVQNSQSNELEPQSFYVTQETKFNNFMSHFSKMFGDSSKWAIAVKFKIESESIKKIKENTPTLTSGLITLLGGLEALIVFVVETACTNGKLEIKPEMDKKKLCETEYTLTIPGNIDTNILEQPQTIFNQGEGLSGFLSKEAHIRRLIDNAIVEENKKLAEENQPAMDLNILEKPATRLALLPNLQDLVGEYGKLISIEVVKR